MNNIVFNYVLEVLAILANATTVLGFILERWEKHKRQRMEAEETEKPAGTGFPNH